MTMRGELQPELKKDAPDPRVIMRREGRTLVYFALASGAAFITLVGIRMMLGEPPHAFDNAILASLRHPDNPAIPVGPPWLLATARDVTALGGWPVMTLLTALLSGYLATRREWGIIALVVSAVIGQSLVVHFMKDFIGRERPSVVPHLVDVSSLSFPSGHAASAAALYLVLGAILARSAQHNGQRVYVIAAAITLTLLIAASRVYLGVHYPTDVLAGLCVGAIWASLVWLAAYYLQHRK